MTTPKQPWREDVADFCLRPLEPRRLLSARAGMVGAAVMPLELDADGPVVERPLVDLDALAVRLGTVERPVSTTIAGAWTRAADLSRYAPAQIEATTRWAVLLPTGVTPAGLSARVGAPVQPSGPIANVAIADLSDLNGGAARINALRRAGVREFYPLVPLDRTARFTPNDQMFVNQWHLNNTGQGGGMVGADANVLEAWDRTGPDGSRLDGSGVTIGIVDDGVYWNHPDLQENYDAAHSYDFVGNDADPYPTYRNSHGTKVAGVAAAVGNNALGVTGAGFAADFTGLRVLGSNQTDAREAAALGYFNDVTDIYTNSWGPIDDGARLEGPGPLTAAAIEETARNGRGGLGGILTWAGGNGGDFDNVNRDGYASSRHTIAVAAVTNFGDRSWYSEPGASLLIAAPSNGGSRGITTVDGVSNYTNDFGGTSSATPLVSGVIALILEANPNLTARDVQHILVETAFKTDPADASWRINGAGHEVSDYYGFGRIDAEAAVAAAISWQRVGEETVLRSDTQSVNVVIPDNHGAGLTRTLTLPAGVTAEHVEVAFDADHPFRGDLDITLTSPSGTVSRLFRPNSYLHPIHNEKAGDAGDEIQNWTFTSVQQWGEDSGGEWTLRVADTFGADVGTWNHWSIRVYGTEAVPTPPAPQVIAGAFDFADRHAVTFSFDQDVSASLDDEDVLLRDVVTNATFAAELAGYDAATNTATYVPAVSPDVTQAPEGRLLPSGRYEATLMGDVTNAGGKAVEPAAPIDFWFLAGDANRDETVSLADFLILRSHFGASPATFGQADFNYDGTVSLADFLILRSQFGQSLPPPPSALPGLFDGDDDGGSRVRGVLA